MIDRCDTRYSPGVGFCDTLVGGETGGFAASALLLAPGLTGALVLGELHSRSALGEPFTGRIELPDITPDELSALEVRLASQAEFDRADTVRPRFLTELEFEPRTFPEGRTMI